jgi:hypothetical protein
MSMYRILGTPVPTISYCIFHQAASSGSVEKYLDTLRELHSSVRRETASIAAAYAKHVRDVIGRESQALRGSLSEFLQTPMRSDNASVQRIFSDSFERFQEQVVGSPAIGVTRSYEGKVITPAFQKTADRKLVANGTTYLKGLGFVAGKTKGDIFESVFIVEGGMNLDLIEHIIRDRLGIYVETHGKHLDLTGGYSFGAYNLVGSWGQLTRDEVLNGQVELAVFFAKPAMQYAPFRAGLLEALGHVTKRISPRSITLWQRKLGLGKGKEFILRWLCEGSRQAVEILRLLEQQMEPPFVKRVLIDQGHLVLKELLIPDAQ